MVVQRWFMASFLCFVFIVVGGTPSFAQSDAGGTEPGKFILGMRAGFAPLTQSLTSDSSTDVGSLVNFQALYSLNNWLLVGMMLEWERHSIDQVRPNIDLGHQDTVSILPTIEIRPVKFGPIVPYVNMSFGLNVNSFGESNAIAGNQISPSNNFAWRLGWGGDYMLNKQFALNAEMGYKRNDGHATINLKGPIIVNRAALKGKQVIPRNVSSFSLQHPLRVATD